MTSFISFGFTHTSSVASSEGVEASQRAKQRFVFNIIKSKILLVSIYELYNSYFIGIVKVLIFLYNTTGTFDCVYRTADL